MRSLRRSRTGRILVATRDNERAAQSYAVNPIRAKLSAFALSGFFAALAGRCTCSTQHGPFLHAPRPRLEHARLLDGGHRWSRLDPGRLAWARPT